jgi:hypothetical protein
MQAITGKRYNHIDVYCFHGTLADRLPVCGDKPDETWKLIRKAGSLPKCTIQSEIR